MFGPAPPQKGVEATPRIELGMEVLQNDAGPSPAAAGPRFPFESLRRAAPPDANRRGRCG